MNICMLVSNYLPHQGGAEYFAHHLTTALIELGHQVVVIAEHHPAGKRLRYPYPVYHCPRTPFVNREVMETKRFLHALFHLKRRKFDLVHAHIVWEAGLIGAKLKRATRLPLVITPHGGDVQVVPEINYGLCLDPRMANKVRVALKAADIATAVSRRIMLATADRGCDPDCIRVVYPGTEFEKIQRLALNDRRGELGFSDEDFVLLSVGRNSPVKDIPTLLKGLRIAAAKEPRLKCILVGPDEFIRPLLEQERVSDRVKLLGRIPRGADPMNPSEAIFQTPYPELVAAYASCDGFVSTSYVESFNTAALDAFACGKPVVATATQGFMDLLNEGVNGYSIPPRDPNALAEKLLFLARNRDHCRTMGEAARRVAIEYEWNKVAKQFVTVYEEARQRH